MKKGIILLLRTVMTLISVILIVIINTDAKIENQENYNIMQKANIIEEAEHKETIETKEKEKIIAKEDSVKEKVEIKEEKTLKKVSTKKEENITEEKVITTKSEPEQEKTTTKENSIKYGTYGRLYVSNYNVALYDYNVNTSSNLALQTLVDNKDSAAYYKSRGKLVIADHYKQGFSVLTSLSEGSIASIKFEDGKTINYRLIKKSEGVNTGPDLVDNEGNSFYAMESDLIMYTCYDGGIMATLWVLA